MGSVERRERAKATLRREILDAARDLFLAEGYEAVTMRRIADQIEYAPTTIYLHFADKSQLFAALCEETFAQLAARLERIVARETEPLAALRAGLEAYIDFGLKHPGPYRLTFMQPMVPIEGYDYAESAGCRAFRILEHGVAACAAAGVITTTNPQATSQALWAAIPGIVAIQIAHGEVFPFVKRAPLVDALLTPLLAGLSRPRSHKL